MIAEKNKFENIIDILAKILLVLVFAVYIVVWAVVQKDFLLAHIVGLAAAVAIVAAVYLVSQLVTKDIQAVVLLAVGGGAFLAVWALVFKTVPVSDYQVLIEGAKAMVGGSFAQLAADKTNYFCFYNFQIGYTAYLALLMKLFGQSLAALKAVEIVTIVLTNIVLYKTVRIYCDQSKSFFVAAMFAVYPFIFIGSNIINNQHICMLLEAVAIYVFLKYNSIYKYAICGAIVAVAQVLRPTAVVVIIAVFVCALLQGIVQKDKTKLAGAIIAVAVYALLGSGINQAFIMSGLAPYGIKGDNPYFKLVLGLLGEGVTGQPSTSAEKTQLYYDLEFYNFDYKVYKNAAKEKLFSIFGSRELQERVLFVKQFTIKYFIGEIDNQHIYGGVEFPSPFIFKILNYTGMVFYIGSVVLAFVKTVKSKKIISDSNFALPAIIFGGYFAVYLLIEVQTRYRYEQYYMLFLMGLPILYNAINRCCNKLKKNN